MRNFIDYGLGSEGRYVVIQDPSKVKTELTMDEVAEKFGIPVNELKIKQ